MEIKTFLTRSCETQNSVFSRPMVTVLIYCQEHIDYFIIFFNGTGTLNDFLPKCQPEVKEVTTECKRLLPLRKLTSN